MQSGKEELADNGGQSGTAGATEATRKRYDRIARFYDVSEYFVERLLYARWRRRLWQRIGSGHGLEVAVGTGKNFSYYPDGAEIVAIDLSPGMLKEAERRARLLGTNLKLRVMDVEQLDFPDDSFDWTVATFAFCSVPNPVKGLRELGRVCRPNGFIFLLEHMRADWPIAGRLMDWLNPLVVHVIGANINRRTVDNVRRAGLSIAGIEDLTPGGVFRILVLQPAAGGHEELGV